MSDQVTGLLSPWLRKKRIQAVLPHIKGKVLDYGCGVGALAPFCNKESYLGVDIDKESIEIAKADHPGYRFQLELPKTEKFDTIAALAVIEHISQPTLLLKTFQEILSDQGSVVLTTPRPFTESIHSIGSKVGLFSGDAEEEHEELIDLKKMKTIAEKTSLEVVLYKKFLFGANQVFQLKNKF